MKKLIFLTLASVLFSCNKQGAKQQQASSSNDTIQQKTGEVWTFAKPKNQMPVLKRDNTVYSENYQTRLGKIAAFYVENSARDIVIYHKNREQSQLGYSIEENDWEGVQYTQIGIFNRAGSNLATLQWLFYEPKSQTLYEFDLYRKKLTLFK